MGLAIGIDLGTTNTVVGAVVNGVAVTLTDEKNRRLIPSIVSFTPDGQVLVGEAARERRITDPKNSIYSVKRLIGRPFNSPEVQYIAERFPFSVVRGEKDATMVVAQGTPYALPEISAFVLRRAKKVAEAQLGEKVDRAVITVPANFNDLQRAATKLAGKLAGLEVLRILNEPTAAALAYGQAIEESERIAVYDLGGGTFDITLLDLDGNVFEVLSTAGDTALGGDDLDSLVAERLSDQVRETYGVDARRDPIAFGRLRLAAETMKRDLSVATVVENEIRDIVYAANGVPIDVRGKLTRAELEQLAQPLVDRTIEVTKQSLTMARLSPQDFRRVILVGGSTRMPLIGRKVGEFFSQPPSVRVNPDEVVALGAAIQAHSLVRTRGDRPKAKKRGAGALDAFPESTGITASPRSALDAFPSREAPRDRETVPALEVAQPVSDVPEPSPSSRAMPVLTFSPPDIREAGADASTRPPPGVDPRRDEDTAASAKSPLLPHFDAKEAPTLAPKDGPSTLPVPASPMPVVPDLGLPPSAAVRLALDAPDMSLIVAPSSAPPGPVAPAVPPPAPVAPPPAAAAPTDDVLPQIPGQPRVQPAAVYVPSKSGETRPWPAMPPPRPRSEPNMPAALYSRADVEPDLGEVEIDPEDEAERARMVEGGGIATRGRAPLLVDVTPLSLLVETVGGYCDVLLAANTPVPCDKTRVFRTAQDGQTRVFIRVAQGASNRFDQNTYLGELELSGISAGKRGEAAISVTFELDADGILNVKAKDKQSGIETRATLRSFGALTEAADIAAMMGRQAQREVV